MTAREAWLLHNTGTLTATTSCTTSTATATAQGPQRDICNKAWRSDTYRACRVGIQVPHGVAADKAINYAHFVEVITSLLGFSETQSESDHVLHYCF